jgi:hypothetical protein
VPFAYLPSGVPHAFLNTTDDPGEIVVVYTPGGGHKFYEELGPLTRNGTPDRTAVAAVFEKYDMTLLGPPLTDDEDPTHQDATAQPAQVTFPHAGAGDRR